MSGRTGFDLVRETLRRSGLRWTATLVLERLGLPAFRLWAERRIDVRVLHSQVTGVLRAWGMPEHHVVTTARHILYADLHGIESHGCAMLLHYDREIAAGVLDPAATPEVLRESGTTTLIDGAGGFGHVPADAAMKRAIESCSRTGIGAAAVRNSGHFGAAGAYAAMAAEVDFIGLAVTNIRKPALVPTGGRSAVLGTNPIAFAAPASRNRPFLLDMATTIVPVGRIVMAWRRGRLIPSAWATNPRGRGLRRPDRAVAHRRLIPLGGGSEETGGHKGYGLAAMVEILSAVLPGMKEGVGHFFLALDPGRFGDIDRFEDTMDEFMDDLRASEPRTSDRAVQVAGDPEYAAADEREKRGIPLTRPVIEDIRSVCERTGARFLLAPSRRGEDTS